MHRERYHHLRLHALEAMCERLTAARRYGEAVEAGLELRFAPNRCVRAPIRRWLGRTWLRAIASRRPASTRVAATCCEASWAWNPRLACKHWLGVSFLSRSR